MTWRRFGLLPVLLLPACSDGSSDPPEPVPGEGTELSSDDLTLGELGAADMKADGAWGAATQCKAIPNLPRLANPRITVSLHGLTLHLTGTGYDKVFPIGPGAIDQDDTSLTYGESLSYDPILRYGRQDFEIRPATTTACKIWYTDPATGQKLPVFAGLPFLSWSGNYAIHGPVDNYRAANGGDLRRGFVSHGCMRMAAADVLEVYARIRGVAHVPVHVQREPERTAAGARTEVQNRWIGAECQQDADCNYPNGFCKRNAYSGRSFCSAHCDRFCSDRAGYPPTFCVADPDSQGHGMCVTKMVAQDQDCRPFDHMVARTASRVNEPGTTATVCLPGSPGWVGDHCFHDSDCQEGNRCVDATGDSFGICSQDCNQFCPDEPGWPWTFCTTEPSLGGAVCLRQCTPASNASECPARSTCTSQVRAGGQGTRNVCVPN